MGIPGVWEFPPLVPLPERRGPVAATRAGAGLTGVIGLHEPDVRMRQDQAEEGGLLALPADLDRRLAEVDLGMARRVMQGNEGLAHGLPTGPDMVLHDRVAAREPVLVPKTLKDPIRRVPLLARHLRIRVRLKDRVDDAGEPVQPRPPDRLGPTVDAEPPTGLMMLRPSSTTASRTAAS